MKDKEKSYCENCDHQTNHAVLFKDQIRGDSDEYDYILDHMVVRCLGCDSISFRKVFVDIESSYPDYDGTWIVDKTVETFPKKERVSKHLKNSNILPDRIKIIYEEAINAFNAKCYILTGVAFRAIIESICLEENIRGRNLEKKINNLVKQKLITEREAKRLHSIRFIGNDSVHEMKVPKEKSLLIVLGILEHLLNNIYLIDIDIEKLLETVIDEYDEFEKLLTTKVKKMGSGTEVPLAMILGKDVRRFNGKLNEFENELIANLKSNKYSKLTIGKIDIFGNDNNKRQHYKIA